MIIIFAAKNRRPGYTAYEGTVSCPGNAQEGADPDFTGVVCDEVKCNPLLLSYGTVGGEVDPCINGQSLTTNTDQTCSVRCKAGFTGRSALVVCEADSTWGTVAATNSSCVENR